MLDLEWELTPIRFGKAWNLVRRLSLRLASYELSLSYLVTLLLSPSCDERFMASSGSASPIAYSAARELY